MTEAFDDSAAVEALEQCSNTVELREFAARAAAAADRAAAFADRAKGALIARANKAPYPSRVPPSTVLAFLELHQLVPALCVSTAWYGQAEEVFRAIATRFGLTGSAPWRDVLRDYYTVGWDRVFDHTFRAGQIEMDNYDSEAINDAGDDAFYIGRGVEFAQHATLAWELHMVRPPHILADACGVALIDGDRCADQKTLDPDDVLKVFLWNSTGREYGGTTELQSRAVEFVSPAADNSDDENYRFYELDATLRLNVFHHVSRVPGKGTIFMFNLHVSESDSAKGWRTLDPMRQYEHPTALPKRTIVAPIVRLCQGSRAKLLRFRRPPGVGARAFAEFAFPAYK